MQINNVVLVRVIDEFIRTRLFYHPFDPFADNNWRVLLLSQAGITQHIVKEVSQTIYDMQNNIKVEDAVVIKKYFSEVDELKMRENFSLPVTKTIYERLPYPSNKGELEKNFILYCDSDSGVDSFLKINENQHHFAHMNYIRTRVDHPETNPPTIEIKVNHFSGVQAGGIINPIVDKEKRCLIFRNIHLLHLPCHHKTHAFCNISNPVCNPLKVMCRPY